MRTGLKIALGSPIFIVGLYSGLISTFYDSFETYYGSLNNALPGLPAALATGAVAWVAFRTNAAVNIRNKRADVIIHCNNRYDEIYKLKIEIESNIDDPERSKEIPYLRKAYFRRYWGLKSDQLDYWFAGYVDPETISSWFMSVVDDLSVASKTRRLPRVGGVTYRESWKEVRGNHEAINIRLVEIVENIVNKISIIEERTHKYAALLALMDRIENKESKLISELRRDSHSRFKIDELPETLDEYSKILYYHYSSVERYRAPRNDVRYWGMIVEYLRYRLGLRVIVSTVKSDDSVKEDVSRR